MTLYSKHMRKLDDIESAINDAVRFISAARAAHAAIKLETEPPYHSKSFAAAKRAMCGQMPSVKHYLETWAWYGE